MYINLWYIDKLSFMNLVFIAVQLYYKYRYEFFLFGFCFEYFLLNSILTKLSREVVVVGIVKLKVKQQMSNNWDMRNLIFTWLLTSNLQLQKTNL